MANNNKDITSINIKRKLLILVIFLPLITTLFIKFPKIQTPISNIIIEQKKDSPIGKIIINKINLKNYLYPINSNENAINKNITILKESTFPDQENSIMIIAAHSGTGDIAYFEDLDKLEINDEIIILYKGINYHYLVKNIWEEKKNGFINVNKEVEKQLVLTTCSPNKKGYQLIINCIEKEPN